MAYNAIITKLSGVGPHSNADRLKVANCYGNQVIIGLEQMDGDVGIYFPSDGKLSEEFCKANNLIGYNDPETGERKGGYFSSNRKVRAQKFRGEKSDGFWIPITSLEFTKVKVESLGEGFQFDSIEGIKICEKFVTKSSQTRGQSKNNQKAKKEKNIMFREHFDTQQYAYNKDKIQYGSLIIITEKVHGTSARTSYCKEAIKLGLIKRIINKIVPVFRTSQWINLTGTRRVEIHKFSKEGGFYGSNEFRRQWHNLFSGKLRKGETVYYEIVGWVDQEMTIMPRCKNKKIGDKEFSKKYGEETTFSYGCQPGSSDIYVYRITMSNEDGETIEYPWSAVKARCEELEVKVVPQLMKPFVLEEKDPSGAHDRDMLDFIVEQYGDGTSTIDNRHVREGVVVRSENQGENIYVLKHKNFNFKVLEGIIKDDETVVDIEEAESL